MKRRRNNLVLRISFAVFAFGLLSAFSYPLVQEGYERAGGAVYKRAQEQLIFQSIHEYLNFKKSPGWNVDTCTKQILTDLEKGIDRDMDGKLESFLPSNTTPELLSRHYRIVFKSPQNYKVLPR